MRTGSGAGTPGRAGSRRRAWRPEATKAAAAANDHGKLTSLQKEKQELEGDMATFKKFFLPGYGIVLAFAVGTGLTLELILYRRARRALAARSQRRDS